MSDFTVQVRGSCLAVTSPRVFEVATGELIGFEELGGVDVHARMTGQIDLGVESDEEAWARRPALAVVPAVQRLDAGPAADAGHSGRPRTRPRRWPSWCRRSGPGATTCAGCSAGCCDAGQLLRAAARSSGATSPPGSAASTAGRSASSPPTPCSRPACSTATPARRSPGCWCCATPSTCPCCSCQDVPGFLVGKAVEHERLLYRAMRLRQALTLCRCPTLTVIVRKAFGLAFKAMNGTGMGADAMLRLARRRDRLHGSRRGRQRRAPRRPPAPRREAA